jgi:hypothetical protein
MWVIPINVTWFPTQVAEAMPRGHGPAQARGFNAAALYSVSARFQAFGGWGCRKSRPWPDTGRIALQRLVSYR